MKIGEYITIPKTRVHRTTTERTIEEYDNWLAGGTFKIYGFDWIDGKEYVRVDTDDYEGTNFHLILKEDLLINIKQKNMTTKAIAIAKARTWPAKDLTNGQKFLTKQGEIYIHKLKDGRIWVLSNNSILDGNTPGRMPAGWKYSYYLHVGGSIPTTIDLTCNGRLSAFKEYVGEQQFSADIVVSGVPSLLKAIKEEAEELGWEFSGDEITKSTRALHFNKGVFGVCPELGVDFVLADEWDYVMEEIAEKEDNVEYLECVVDDEVENGITKGRIYKRDADEEYHDENDYCIEEGDFEYADLHWDRSSFKPSTEEAFEAQGVNISSVGGHKINIKEVKINGYKSMKMACIGCAGSQQVYSLGALKVIYDVMCDNEGTFDEEGVDFTKDQVEALIEALS